MKRFIILIVFVLFAAPAGAEEGKNSQVYPLGRTFIKVTQKLKMSIVGITPTKTKVKKKETFRERYWRLRREKTLGISTKGKVGTGIVLDDQGHILTSLAIVPSRKGKKLSVTFADGKEFDAEVKKKYEGVGAAILKLDQPYGKGASFGSTTQLKLGQIVATLGNPYSSISRVFQISVSMGRISGLYKVKDKFYQGLAIETDAAINKGSYGGPLVDTSGNIIGMVIPSFSKVRWQGLAVPIEHLLTEINWPHVAQSNSSALPELEKRIYSGFQTFSPWVVTLEFAYPLNPAFRKDNYYQRPRVPCTGVIIDDQGHILTSAFNLKGVKGKVTVRTSKGKRVEAKILGRDLSLDLALLKAQGPLPGNKAPQWMDTSKSQVGDFLMVIGRPWSKPHQGTAYTLNTGILSSVHRFRDRVYQLDSSINFGNLGGAVTSQDGDFMGLVVRLSRRTGNSSGVGFFIPCHILKKALVPLKKGKVIPPFAQGYIGVQLHSVNNRVLNVVKASPAHKVGLQVDDIIIAVEGKKIDHKFHLMKIMEKYQAGEKVKVTYERDGNKQTVEITLSALKKFKRKRKIQ